MLQYRGDCSALHGDKCLEWYRCGSTTQGHRGVYASQGLHSNRPHTSLCQCVSPQVSQDVSDVSDTAPEVSQDVSDDSDTQALCWPSFCMCLHMMVYICMYICTYVRMYIRTLRSYQCKRTHLRYITSYPVFAGLVAKYKACYV